MLRLRGDRWIAIEFKLTAIWIGVGWHYKTANYWTLRGHCIEELHLWICLLPCLPLHFVGASKYEEKECSE